MLKLIVCYNGDQANNDWVKLLCARCRRIQQFVLYLTTIIKNSACGPPAPWFVLSMRSS